MNKWLQRSWTCLCNVAHSIIGYELIFFWGWFICISTYFIRFNNCLDRVIWIRRIFFKNILNALIYRSKPTGWKTTGLLDSNHRKTDLLDNMVPSTSISEVCQSSNTKDSKLKHRQTAEKALWVQHKYHSWYVDKSLHFKCIFSAIKCRLKFSDLVIS